MKDALEVPDTDSLGKRGYANMTDTQKVKGEDKGKGSGLAFSVKTVKQGAVV